MNSQVSGLLGRVRHGRPKSGRRGDLRWRAGRVGHLRLDGTGALTGLTQKISGWRVNDNVTLSDHLPISFQIGVKKELKAPRANSTGWWWQEERRESLIGKARGHLEALPDSNPKNIVKAIQRACNCTLKGKFSSGRRPVYWWTSEVPAIRRTCLCARRKLTRARKKKPGEIHAAQ
jgi:hypothetical protein